MQGGPSACEQDARGWGGGVEVGRALGCGPGSIEGLQWLARVGPCPLEAWRSAMGWSEVAARSHARRLEGAGWLGRQPMVRGDGCLFWATRSGTNHAAVSARPVRRVTPAMWSQHCATAWTASWLKLCGHEFLGPREILDCLEWAAEIRWGDHRGSYRATARPDFVARLGDGGCVAIQLDLTATSSERRQADLMQHAAWQAAGQSAWVHYVCADETSLGRIRKQAAAVGLSEGHGTLALELLDTVKQSARTMFRERRLPPTR